MSVGPPNYTSLYLLKNTSFRPFPNFPSGFPVWRIEHVGWLQLACNTELLRQVHGHGAVMQANGSYSMTSLVPPSIKPSSVASLLWTFKSHNPVELPRTALTSTP